MYASDWRSDAVSGPASPPRRQRSQGRCRLEAVRLGAVTRAGRIAEGGPSRIRLPRAAGPALEAVLINTGGGIACGDRFEARLEAGPGAELLATTQAAEKVYKSDGAAAELALSLLVAERAILAWLPQETILYDRGRLLRRLDADLADDATLLAFEAVQFGRSAFGERVEEGLFEDRWRIRRGGRLVYADTLRLAGPIDALLARPAIAGGCRALATFLYVAPDAEARLDEARGLLANAAGEVGASAWDGLLAVRFLAPEIAMLRRDAIPFLTGFRGAPLPRVWQC